MLLGCALLGWALLGCEASPTGAGAWLEDVTSETGVAFERPLPEGYDHLIARLGGGVCVLDLDGAPPRELFFPMRGGSRLYRGSGAWRWEDATARFDGAGIDAIGCLVLDLDRDGDDDLVVAGVGALAAFRSEAGRLVAAPELLSATVAPGHALTSMAAGDVDGDGDADLVVAGFADVAERGSGDCGGVPCAVLVSTQIAVPNRLFLREDAGYVEADAAAGPLALPEPTLLVGVADADGDGRAEVYVGNDLGDVVHDRVLAWDGAALVDASERLGMAYDAHGHGVDTMGWTRGDVNGDGRVDVAVTPFDGFHSPVFVCGEDGFCEDEGRARGTGAVASSFRWGNALVDLDLDGDLDLFEATGHVFTEAEGAALGHRIEHAQRPNLLENDGAGHFAPVELGVGRYEARGLAVADLDDDGRPDVVLTTTRGGPVFLRNVRAPGGRWLRLRLRGGAADPDAIGARVEVGGQVREVVRGEGAFGSFEPELTVGGLDADRVAVEVRWPSGARERRELATGQTAELSER